MHSSTFNSVGLPIGRLPFFQKNNEESLRTVFFFWFWDFCTLSGVNLPTTFRKPLWVPSLLVMNRNGNNQRKGLLPYIGATAHSFGSHSYSWPGKMASTAVSKRRRQIHLANRAEPPKPKNNIHFTVKAKNQDQAQRTIAFSNEYFSWL